MEIETVIQYRFVYFDRQGEWQDLAEEIPLNSNRRAWEPMHYMQTRTITREKPKPKPKKICGAESPFEMDSEHLYCEEVEHGSELRHHRRYLATEHDHDPLHECVHQFYWD